MTTLTLAFQLILAAVFAVAGIAKLADLGGSRRPLVLPPLELAIAGALLPDASARWGAAAALALLGVFGLRLGRWT